MGPSARLLDYIPKNAKRLGRYLLNPSIPEGKVAETELSYVYIDFVASLAAISGVIAALKYLLPDYLEINPVSLINWHIFVLMLITNAVFFSLILYALLAIPLLIKERKCHSKIYYQSIKAFAIENILVAVMVTVAINRIIVKGNFKSTTGSLDLWMGSISAIASLFLLVWLIAIPLSAYMRQYYKRSIAYAFGFSAVVVVAIVNPAIASKYFSRIIDSKEFCSQYVSYRFKEELADCTYNKECLIGKCLAEKDKFIEP